MRPSLRLLAAALALGSSTALAAAPAVSVEATPLLGQGSSMSEGWTGFAVWLRNPSTSEVVGTVELAAKPAWARDQKRVLTTAPFALAPGAHVALQLPSHGFANTPAEFELTVYDTSRAKLSTLALPELRQSDPLLVDLTSPSRMAPGVRGVGLVVRLRAGGRYRTPSALVATPTTDPVTGDPVLPRWAAGYASASLVATSGKRLATLGKLEQKALADWVLAGGSLAIAVERPEDTRLDMLASFVGGPVVRVAPPRELLERSEFFLPSEAPAAPSRTPGAGSAVLSERLLPRPETANALEGFQGGNLRPSPWGAVASYGLGEVHLLAFDLGEPYASDRWAQLKLVDLLRHAWERQAAVALPLGRTPFDHYAVGAVRSVLDPNRSVRWTVIAAALILLAYAAFAGPVSFWLAARRGKPLRALLHLPLWAAGTLLLIVVIGLIGKGVKGRARRLTLLEVGSGMERGAATRFRGFYASSSREISVYPSTRSSLLEVAAGDDFVERTLVVDRDGPRLEQLRTKPWATVVVRDDGFANLAGGISIVRQSDGNVAIKNRAARHLIGAVLKVPGEPPVLFDRIQDGELAVKSRGKPLSASIGAAVPYSPVHALNSSLFAATLDQLGVRLGEAWTALETQAGNEVDWWPADVPVLIAALDGGEGTLKDSGFEVDEDRVLVRVVGWGGVP